MIVEIDLQLVVTNLQGPAMSKRPRIFICSTVIDFRDLRSALRFYLEQFGFEVLMSEANDFPQQGGNSYQSCLDVIDTCDFMILLVGGRVGAMIDKEKTMSITRAEYEHAYERVKAGQMRLLSFVRKEVWDIREDRRALEKHVKQEHEKLTAEQVDEIKNHSSRFVDDAKRIFEFIDKIRRVDEMRERTAPVGNWVYQFESFKDIIDACVPALNLTGDLDEKAMIGNLIHELEYNASRTFVRIGETVFPVTNYSAHARAKIKGSMAGDSVYTGMELTQLMLFLVFRGSIGTHFRDMILHEAILSGRFLDYDMATGAKYVGPLQEALIAVLQQIKMCRNMMNQENISRLIGLLMNPVYAKNLEATYSLKNVDLGLLFTVHDCVLNIRKMIRAIYRTLTKRVPLANVELTVLNFTGRGATVDGEVQEVPMQFVKEWLAECPNS
jgi:Domain of unknown function (DUF4062)